MKPLRVLVVSLIAVSLSACAVFSDKKIDYKAAHETRKPLEVPPDLAAPDQGSEVLAPADVPERSASYSDYSEQKSVSAASPEGKVLPRTEGVTLMRDGAQRWLVVAAGPDAVWPLVKSFFVKNGLSIEVERPEAGVIETGWAENYAKVQSDVLHRYLSKVFPRLYKAGIQDRYRVRLDHGQKPGTTEIYLTHRQLVEVEQKDIGGNKEFKWEPAPSDPDLEAEMLRLLMVHLGAEQTRARELLAGAKPAVKVAMRDDKGERVITIDEDYDDAWRRVGLAIDRAGAGIEDRDRTKGVYYVSYQAKKDASGFWSRLSGDENIAGYLRVSVATGKPAEVRVKPASEAEKKDQARLAQQLLDRLYEQLK